MKCAFYYSHTVLRIFSLRKVKLHGPGHTMGGILGYKIKQTRCCLFLVNGFEYHVRGAYGFADI